jgi:cellulose biosynthesis protein BcsQ
MQSDAGKMPLKGKRIGVLGKGGAGKSTVTVPLAQALHTRGYSVCVWMLTPLTLDYSRSLRFLNLQDL